MNGAHKHTSKKILSWILSGAILTTNTLALAPTTSKIENVGFSVGICAGATFNKGKASINKRWLNAQDLAMTASIIEQINALNIGKRVAAAVGGVLADMGQAVGTNLPYTYTATLLNNSPIVAGSLASIVASSRTDPLTTMVQSFWSKLSLSAQNSLLENTAFTTTTLDNLTSSNLNSILSGAALVALTENSAIDFSTLSVPNLGATMTYSTASYGPVQVVDAVGPFLDKLMFYKSLVIQSGSNWSNSNLTGFVSTLNSIVNKCFDNYFRYDVDFSSWYKGQGMYSTASASNPTAGSWASIYNSTATDNLTTIVKSFISGINAALPSGTDVPSGFYTGSVNGYPYQDIDDYRYLNGAPDPNYFSSLFSSLNSSVTQNPIAITIPNDVVADPARFTDTNYTSKSATKTYSVTSESVTDTIKEFDKIKNILQDKAAEYLKTYNAEMSSMYQAATSTAGPALKSAFTNVFGETYSPATTVSGAQEELTNLTTALTTLGSPNTTTGSASNIDCSGFGNNGSSNRNATGFIIEPFIGYDFKNGKCNFGADLAFGYEMGGRPTFNVTNAVANSKGVTIRREFAITLMPRIGWQFTPKFEVFLAVGAAYSKYKINKANIATLTPNSNALGQMINSYNATVNTYNTANPNAPLPYINSDSIVIGTTQKAASKMNLVPMFGIGCRFNITPKIYGKLEFDMALSTKISNGAKDGLTIKFQSNILKAGIGVRV